MKYVKIESFVSLEDALLWLENALADILYDISSEDIKGEVIMIDGKWRASVETNCHQIEMYDWFKNESI